MPLRTKEARIPAPRRAAQLSSARPRAALLHITTGAHRQQGGLFRSVGGEVLDRGAARQRTRYQARRVLVVGHVVQRDGDRGVRGARQRGALAARPTHHRAPAARWS
jgi:hypothetical protein